MLLSAVKLRCGIPETLTLYDEPEIIPLIQSAVDDMKSAGVPESILSFGTDDDISGINPRVLTALVFYVQAFRGSDRNDTNHYVRHYRNALHKLMLEPEVNEDVDN